MKTTYQHFFTGDIPIGGGWISREHIEKHIEISGSSGQGKTTLTEQLFLGIMEQAPAGMLLIDPKGHSVEKWLGWVAEGRIKRSVWLVDTAGPVLRYNPLAVDKNPRKVATTVAGLFEALALIQKDATPGQHRQMRRFVTATLRALIECDLTISDAYEWLTSATFRSGHLNEYVRRGNITPDRMPEWIKEWRREPSGSKLESTENFFAAFWEHDWVKDMYGGDGFSWQAVYDDQPLVLVNLNGLAGSLNYSQAVAAMFLTGLLEHARQVATPKRWYAIIEDATDYTPAHVGPVLRLGRAFELYLTLIHHERFEGGLQAAVDLGCRTKFVFGEYGQGAEHIWLPGFSCAHIFDRRPVQYLSLRPAPAATTRTSKLKEKIFSHPWYGPAEVRSHQMATVAATIPETAPPSDKIEADPKRAKPKPPTDRPRI